jgi:hypothetical protein
MLPLAIITTIVFAVIVIFSFPRFSPIPYYPSNRKDLGLIIKALDLKNNQTIIDFGAGDGTVIFAGAKTALGKKLSIQFIAVDINPVLVLIMHIRRFFHPNKKNIKIVWGDMFKGSLINFKINDPTIYLYISPWYIDKVINGVTDNFKKYRIVSYMYPVKSLKEKEVIKGINKIYRYDIV